MKDDSVNSLIETVKRLRAPDGCPWDREQTHKSIRGHLVEECAELLEAIDLESPEKMREELGDVLMHLVLHAEIESENGRFDFYDVARELKEKLVRRHPHVFGERKAADSGEVLKIWQDVKTKEKKERAVGKLFDGIPPQLSALRYALDIAKKPRTPLLKTPRRKSDAQCSSLSERRRRRKSNPNPPCATIFWKSARKPKKRASRTCPNPTATHSLRRFRRAGKPSA